MKKEAIKFTRLSAIGILLILGTIVGFAQNLTVKGTVKDTSGEPVLGATVVVEGKSGMGTATDINGQYTISNLSPNATLSFSYVGMKTQKVAVNGRTVIDITMESNDELLNEVVVVGYGTQKKANLTGTVNTVKAEDLVGKASTSLATAMQGLVPGVTIISRPGDVGSDMGNINVRGRGNLGASSPLFIVDGIPVSEGEFQRINPHDIESMSILKDAAASSIYGSRAAYGVFLITTKKGSAGKATVSYNGYYGWQSPTILPKKLNANDFAMLTNESFTNAGKEAPYNQDVLAKIKAGSDPDLYPDNDWYSMVYRKSTPIQEHNISVSGGGKTRYYVSGTFYEQQSLVRGRKLDRYSIRSNVERDFTDKFKLGTNVSLIRDDFQRDGNFSITDLNRMTPLTVARQSDGSWGSITAGQVSSVLAKDNPLRKIAEYGWKKDGTTRFIASLNATLKPIKGLDINAILSYDYYFRNQSEFFNTVAPVIDFIKKQPITSTALNVNRLYNTWDNSTTLMSQLFATYSKTFGLNDMSLMVGSQFEKYKSERLGAGRKNFPSNQMGAIDGGSSAFENLENEGNIKERAFLSAFSRFNYAYAGKYLFEANLRMDKSSQFAKEKRTGYFPSFSAAWRMSEEQFMKSLTWVDNLKLRLSWGKLGYINNVGFYDYLDMLGTGVATIIGENKVDGIWPDRLANTNLSWETVTMKNIGVDASLFNNSLSMQLDLFDKFTDDILLRMPQPWEMGLTKKQTPSLNAGKVSNKGIEFSAIYRNNISEFKYSINGNLSKIWNKVVDLNGQNDQINDVFIYREGEAIGSFFTYVADGLFKDQADIDGHSFKQDAATKPGDIKYKDVDGDHKFTANDRTITGNDVPYFTYGLGLSAEYKGFDFTIQGQGVNDVKVYLSAEASQAFFNGAGAKEFHLKRWTAANPDPNAAYPRILQTSDNKHNARTSSFWLFDADYFRVKNITLGYTVPNALTSKIGVEKVRVFLNATNLFTIRADKRLCDFDPEMPSSRGAYPNMKVVSFGLNVNF